MKIFDDKDKNTALITIVWSTGAVETILARDVEVVVTANTTLKITSPRVLTEQALTGKKLEPLRVPPEPLD